MYGIASGVFVAGGVACVVSIGKPVTVDVGVGVAVAVLAVVDIAVDVAVGILVGVSVSKRLPFQLVWAQRWQWACCLRYLLRC